jgi:Skp family chaperone for outer membrane proteins
MKSMIPALLLAMALPVAAQPQGQMAQQSPTQMFMEQKDANKDGKVTLDEFQKPTAEQLKGMEEQFKYMDKNGDGGVTTDELEAFHQEMQQRMQQMQQQQMQRGGQQYR